MATILVVITLYSYFSQGIGKPYRNRQNQPQEGIDMSNLNNQYSTGGSLQGKIPTMASCEGSVEHSYSFNRWII